MLSATIAVYALSDKIQEAVLKEVNEQLAVEGAFKKLEVTFWKSFPKIGIKLNRLTLKESENLLDTFLFEADEFYLQFGLIDALFGKYELDKIKAVNPHLRLAIDGDKQNFDLFKNNSTDSINDDNIKIDLKSIVLENAHIEYHDLKEKTKIVYDFEKFKAKGEIESEKIDFGIEAKGEGKSFVVSGDTLPISKQTGLNVQLRYEPEFEKLSFENGTLEIEKTVLELNGFLVFADKNSMDIKVESKGNRIDKITGLLPKKIGDELNSFKSEGEFSFKAQIAGDFGQNKMPQINALVKISNGKLFPKSGQKPMENINLNANLMFSKTKEYVQVPVFSFKLGEHNFKGNFDLNGFDDPFVQGNFLGSIQLENIDELFDFENIELSGLLNCDFNLEGRISELSSGKKIKEKGIFGKMSWQNLSFQSSLNGLDKWMLSESNADWQMRGNQILTSNMVGKLNQSDFNLKLSLDMFLPYLFGNTKAEVFADLMLNRLEIPSEYFETEKESIDTITDLHALFPENISLDLKFKLGEFISNKIQLAQLSGELFASETKIDIPTISGNTAEGSFSGALLLRKRLDENLFTSIDLVGKDLNINKIFTMFDNFGQEEITDKNLEGRLDISTQMVLIVSRNGLVEKQNMYAFTDLSIKNGVLKNYEAMKEMSDYAEVSELENVRFSSLTNTFEIRDGEINFPYMDIGNNVMNLKIKGKHNFDNYMDYTIRVNLSDALAAKYKIRSKKKAEDFEELGEKGIALYIRMTGYADNLQFKFEKVGGRPVLVPETVSQEVKNAREDFKQTIKQEFNTESREEKNKKEAEKEKVDWDE